MNDLIESLLIFAKYITDDPHSPTHCEHDVMYVVSPSPSVVSEEHTQRLDELGWHVTEEHGLPMFASFRFGSA